MKRLGALLVGIGIAVACVIFWRHVRNEFFVLMGSRNEAGGWYGFNSGAGGAFYMAAIPATLVFYWQHTCHHGPTCLRWGKYEAAGGMFKLCRRHHPDMQTFEPIHELIARLHREHNEQHRSRPAGSDAKSA